MGTDYEGNTTIQGLIMHSNTKNILNSKRVREMETNEIFLIRKIKINS